MTTGTRDTPEGDPHDFANLRAVYLNCTLKRSPQRSHTAGLMAVSSAIMRAQGVTVDDIRIADHEIPAGVQKDMTEHGRDTDAWPHILDRVMEANIVVVGSPIWLGERSSICSKLIERLYASGGDRNEKGQSVFYGRTAGCVITGNEDGIKHCAMSILYALQHLGFAIPPQADAGWIGEAGPGPSYLDSGSGGPENEFTQRNTTFMTWNLLHLAAMLRSAGGFPTHGNRRDQWEAGRDFDHPNPEYR
ncbi:MAG: NAD(P)H-dependent oxidoreductase [Polyangiales bacterium]